MGKFMKGDLTWRQIDRAELEVGVMGSSSWLTFAEPLVAWQKARLFENRTQDKPSS
jgi:hypothetical protein